MTEARATSIELVLPDELASALEVAARRNDRSLSEEIAFRLARSLKPEKPGFLLSEAELFKTVSETVRMADRKAKGRRSS